MTTNRFTARRFIKTATLAFAALFASTLVAPSASAVYLGENRIESIDRPGMCLASNGSVLRLSGCNWNWTDAEQSWILNTTGNTPNGYDQVTIRHHATNRYLVAYYRADQLGTWGGIYMAVEGANGTNKIYWDGVGSSWQDVKLQAFTDRTNWARSCLDVNHPSLGSTCGSGVNAQRWKLTRR
ncbi:hypothetical protein PV646_37590 [Streptomyces sp. ID05-26A]|nr:hypothetical protein [Streptomyces sp. ID05-26A]